MCPSRPRAVKDPLVVLPLKDVPAPIHSFPPENAVTFPPVGCESEPVTTRAKNLRPLFRASRVRRPSFREKTTLPLRFVEHDPDVKRTPGKMLSAAVPGPQKRTVEPTSVPHGGQPFAVGRAAGAAHPL